MEETFVIRTCGCHVGSVGTVSVARTRPAAIMVAERIGAFTPNSTAGAARFLEGVEGMPGVFLIGAAPCSGPSGLRHYAEITAVDEFVPGTKGAQ